MGTLSALRTESVPLFPYSPQGRARPNQDERGSDEADAEGKGGPGPETAELGQGKGAQIGAG